jgi:hypothetical protein
MTVSQLESNPRPLDSRPRDPGKGISQCSKKCFVPLADDFDPDGDMPANGDPMTEYLSCYLADVPGAAVGDIKFTLEDFKRYIAGLSK